MASGKWPPVKNAAWRVTFPILDADGDLVTGATSPDSERSINSGTFADCSNEATEIATSSGMYYLDLNASEMNGDTIAFIIKSGSGKTTPIVVYPVSGSFNEIYSDTTIIASDVVVVDAALSDVLSELVIVKSDLVVVDAAMSDMLSELVIVKSDLVVIDTLAAGIFAATVLASGTADSGTTTTMTDSARTEGDATYWVGDWIEFTNGNIAGQVREITGFNAGTDTITFSPATTQAVSTHNYNIIPGVAASGMSAAQDSTLTAIESDLILVDAGMSDVLSELVIVKSDLVLIDQDTSDLKSDLVVVDAAMSDVLSELVIVKSDLVVVTAAESDVESSLVIIKSDLVALDNAVSDVESSLVITKSDLVVLTNAVSDVESSLVIVKSDLVISNSDTTAIHSDTTIIASDAVIIGSDIIALNNYDPTAQITESYAANGVAPTRDQAMMAIHQMLQQFGIAGTSLTVRKLNNNDTAFIVTLDDSASPTDAKRV